VKARYDLNCVTLYPVPLNRTVLIYSASLYVSELMKSSFVLSVMKKCKIGLHSGVQQHRNSYSVVCLDFVSMLFGENKYTF